jgi:cell division protein FtsW
MKSNAIHADFIYGPRDEARARRSDLPPAGAGSRPMSHELSETPDAPAGRADGWIIFLAAALMAFGVVMVYSASLSLEDAPIDVWQWWRTPLRQAAFATAGFVAMLAAAGLDHRMWAWRRRGGLWRVALLALLACALLVAVLVPGVGSTALGARRQIFLGAGGLRIGFQPGEFAKIVLVVLVAAIATRPGFDVRRLGGFFTVMAAAGALIGLTGIEDFGTAALMGVVTVLMLLLARARWMHIGMLGVLGAAAGALLIAMKPYRWARIASVFTENADPTGEGYQITQSLLAIGSGGWWGAGLGAGVRKFDYLPHDENDFIFSIICEELGVAGGLAVIAAFVLFLWCGFAAARRCRDPFGKLLATGLTLTICLQAAMNIAVATHMVPTKGISLPFVSAGGSGVFFLGIAAGLIAAAGRDRAGEAGHLAEKKA